MWSVEILEKLLTEPSEALICDIKAIEGDIMILGAGGKMGPSLAMLARNAVKATNINKKIIAVSRFSDKEVESELVAAGIETISCDLQDVEALYALPDCKNIIYMAGRKFGTDGNEWATWGMNATLPAFVAHKFRNSNIVVFSSGNIYSITKTENGGSLESDKVGPIGDYTQSCLARERAFEFASHKYGTKVLIFRLNYAIDLRYGVLCDIAESIIAHRPLKIETSSVTFIWQGSANEFAIRSLLHCEAPSAVLNVSGEIVSVRDCAVKMAKMLGIEPLFEGEEQGDGYILNTDKMRAKLGKPSVDTDTLMKWQTEWLLEGLPTLGKPTHFEERHGSY